MQEIWVPIIFNDRYFVSNFGRIKSFIYKEKILKQYKTRKGYFSVNLYNNGASTSHLVHRLVLLSFLNDLNIEEVNHLDCIKTNNYLCNLEKSNRKLNAKHAVLMKRYYRPSVMGENHWTKRNPEKKLFGEKNGRSKLTNTLVLSLRKDRNLGLSYRELGKKYKISNVMARDIVLKHKWRNI